jgi:hypothetical protein
MSNPNYTAVLLINDTSSSMYDAVEPMQEVLHDMLEKQARKLAGYLTVDVGYFSSSASQGEQDGDPMLINLGLYASGGTEIYNSSVRLLTTFENRLRSLPQNEQPGNVVVVWMTDGQSSGAPGELPNMIKRLKGVGWSFAFLGSFKGAFASVGAYMGLDKSESIDYSNSDAGRARMADQLGEFISQVRSGEKGQF